MRIPLSLACLTLVACGYEAPVRDVCDGTDQVDCVPPLLNGISGTVVADGISAPATTFITIYLADNPPPPVGTGRPVTFASIPASAYTGEGGVQSAEFAVGNLPDGEYIVNALMDIDGNFNNFALSLAGATCGDFVGTHVRDLSSRETATVAVSGGENVSDVTVLIDTHIPIQRPSFSPVGEPTMSKEQQLHEPSASAAQRYELEVVPVHTAFSETEPLDLDVNPNDLCEDDPQFCRPDTTDADFDMCDSAFWVLGNDVNNDGELDFHPIHGEAEDGGTQLRDIWPRVFVTYMGSEQMTDAGGEPMFDDRGNPIYVNEFASDGWMSQTKTPNPDDIIYAGENFPLLLEYVLTGWPYPLNTPMPFTKLSVLWAPSVRKYYPIGDEDNGEFFGYFGTQGRRYDLPDLREETAKLADVPSGVWGITVIQFTGQTWILPNETINMESSGQGFKPKLQGSYLAVEK